MSREIRHLGFASTVHERPLTRPCRGTRIDPRDAVELYLRTLEEDREPHVQRLPPRRARTSAIPDDVPEGLVKRLRHLGIERLYEHQALARDLVRRGRHVVVATGTASGKTLCYHLPVLERLLDDEAATALYLAPTKALARDQLRMLRAWRLPQLKAAVVDGDTPYAERSAIQRTANWVLTNPDLVHHSLLPGHRYWSDFLHRLEFVVVDECHSARGVFGSHVALVLRRLRRMCAEYGAQPTFVLASATIGNPAEHGARLTGMTEGDEPGGVVAVEIDGSPRGPIDVLLWQPPLLDADAGLRRSTITESGDVLAALVGAGVQTLVFTKSRRAAEVVAEIARGRLESSGSGSGDAAGRGAPDAVAAYRAGYLPSERRDIEERLTAGTLRGVAATQALELGIDVGGLDAVVLAGYPGTVASMWQRFGRAGRGAEAAAGVLVADDDPLDSYLVAHPDELLARDPEDAIVDPQNPYVLAPHLRCACHERPLEDADAVRWFGASAPDVLARDVADGLLRHRAGRYHWTDRERPHGDVNLRSIGGPPYRIVDVDTGALVGDVDAARAFHQVHPGAIYLHQGTTYEVDDLDLDRRVAAVREARGVDHRTRVRSVTEVRVLDELRAFTWEEVDVRLGRVSVTEQVTGYDVLERAGRELLDRVDLDLPPMRLRTVAVWYTIPPAVLEAAGVEPGGVPGALHAAEHAAIGLLPLLARCDRWDIGGLSTSRHADTGAPTVFVYDGYPGGAGLAERSFERFTEHVRATRETVAGCGCASGCPSCVQSPKCGNGNEPLDKDGAVRVLDALLTRAAPVTAKEGQPRD